MRFVPLAQGPSSTFCAGATGATRRYEALQAPNLVRQLLGACDWRAHAPRSGVPSNVHNRLFSSALGSPSATSILSSSPALLAACLCSSSGSSPSLRQCCRTTASIRSHRLFPAFLAALCDRFWPPDDDPPPASSPAPSSFCQLARLSVSPLLSSRCRPPLILCRHGQCQQ